jgi:hypothetical protein
VANCSWVLVDLVIIASLERFITKEVNSGVLYSTGLLRLLFQVLQTISLIPTCGEDVEGDLAANREPIHESNISQQYSYRLQFPPRRISTHVNPR